MSELLTSQDLSNNLFLSFLKKAITSIVLARKSYHEAPIPDTSHNLIVNSNTPLEKLITDFIGPVNLSFTDSTVIYLNINTIRGNISTLIEVWSFKLSQPDPTAPLELFKTPELNSFIRTIKMISTVLPGYEYSKKLRKGPNEYSLDFELCTTQTAAFSNTHVIYKFPELRTRIGSLEVVVEYRNRLESLSESSDFVIDVEQSYRLPEKVTESKAPISIIPDDPWKVLKTSTDSSVLAAPTEKIEFVPITVPEEAIVELPDLSKLTIKEIPNSSGVGDSEVLINLPVDDIPPPVPLSPLEALLARGKPQLKQFQFDDSHVYMSRLSDHRAFLKNISV